MYLDNDEDAHKILKEMHRGHVSEDRYKRDIALGVIPATTDPFEIAIEHIAWCISQGLGPRDFFNSISYPYLRVATWQEAIWVCAEVYAQGVSLELEKSENITNQDARRSSNIYQSWHRLRYDVLRERGPKCEACGRTPHQHGVALHVDHIKPASIYPHLRLDKGNVQILCFDCNIGKSNIDQTDWRDQQEDFGPCMPPKLVHSKRTT